MSRLGLAGDHPTDRAHELFGLEIRIVGSTVAADEAMTDVVVEQPQSDLVQRRPRGVDLGDDVDAIPIVSDHPGDPPDLPFDLGQA